MSARFAGFELHEVAGVPLLLHRDSRFKTFRFALVTQRPLDRSAAARSVLPALLLQGTERDADRPALARRMETLYGAAVLPSCTKLGESQLLRAWLDAISGAHAPGHPDLLGEGLRLLADIMARPRLATPDFPEAVFRREVAQAAHAARALYNDKMAYANERAIACACEGEPFAIPGHGGVAAILALRPDEPERARQDFLMRGRMWGIAMGELPERGIPERVAELLAALPQREPQPVPPPVQPAPRARRSTVERAAVQQSKSVLVFRVPWVEASGTWMARALFASMLGGGPHSRLFRVVREERSLAYYVHAVIERNKGLLQVHVGLDESAAEAVEAEVLRQIGELAAGRFTDNELDTARAGVLSALEALDDSIADRLEFTSRQWLHGQDRTPEQQMQRYAQISPRQVAAAMEGVWLDHSYLLAPLRGN
jgi:predicted Zn-dependent peptidase